MEVEGRTYSGKADYQPRYMCALLILLLKSSADRLRALGARGMALW